MTRTIVGHFARANEAQQAVNALQEAGFTSSDVSYVAHDGTGVFSDAIRARVPSSSGTAKGMAAGGVSGLLLGLAAVAVPGIGPLVAAGPIAAGLAGAGVGAATGGMLGALADIGVPEKDGEYWSRAVSQGGALVIIRTQDDTEARAVQALESSGAQEVRQHTATVASSGVDPSDPHGSPDNYGDEGGSSQWSQTVLRVRDGESEVAKRTFSRFGKVPERLD